MLVELLLQSDFVYQAHYFTKVPCYLPLITCECHVPLQIQIEAIGQFKIDPTSNNQAGVFRTEALISQTRVSYYRFSFAYLSASRNKMFSSLILHVTGEGRKRPQTLFLKTVFGCNATKIKYNTFVKRLGPNKYLKTITNSTGCDKLRRQLSV